MEKPATVNWLDEFLEKWTFRPIDVKMFLSRNVFNRAPVLTHWSRVTHICVSKLAIISSNNELSPGRRQAIIWTNAGILLISPLETNLSEIWIEIQIFSFRKMHLKLSSAKWRPFCLGLKVLNPSLRGGRTMSTLARSPRGIVSGAWRWGSKANGSLSMAQESMVTPHAFFHDYALKGELD